MDKTLEHDPMFSLISRSATCECGRGFQQRLLSERFMRMCEERSQGAVEAILRDIPEMYVPVHCPPCESRDIGRSARMAELRSPSPREVYGGI